VNLEAQAKPGTNRLAGALGVAGNEAPQSDDGEAVRASADFDDTARNPASYARGEADAYVPPANLQSHSLEAHPEQSPVEFSLSAYETERATRHYRVYIGIVLTMLLAWLVYATWHSNAKRSGDRLPAELPAPAIDAPASPAPGEGKGGVSASHASSPSLSKGESNSATASPGNLEGKGKNIESQDTMAGVRHPSPPTLAAQSRDGAIGENGAAELAAAEKYLKAGDGGASQAIPWLWKAVAKQNVDAALVLSDLYLRGDGVVKSCDQARLLLDAAARKGGTTAAEGTNRLLAFGCQ
jgi:TPR repeat protein